MNTRQKHVHSCDIQHARGWAAWRMDSEEDPSKNTLSYLDNVALLEALPAPVKPRVSRSPRLHLARARKHGRKMYATEWVGDGFVKTTQKPKINRRKTTKEKESH